jgi:hypothetical protein
MKTCFLISTLLIVFAFFNISFAQLDTLWTKSYGKLGKDCQLGAYIDKTIDGGYIITGAVGNSNTHNNQPDRDIWLVRVNNDGNILWQKFFDFGNDERGFVVHQTFDGGFILLGYTYDGMKIIKTNTTGDSIWSKSFEGYGNDIKQTVDGGYIITGSTGGPYNAILMKIDASGMINWRQEYNFGLNDNGYTVIPLTDGYVINGSTFFNEDSLWMLKVDLSGNPVWKKDYGAGYSNPPCYQTQDGGFIMVATKTVRNLIWLIKTDESGDTLWTKTYNYNIWEYGQDVKQLDDGGFIILSYQLETFWTQENTFLIRTNEYGDPLWTKSLNHDIDEPSRLIVNSDNTFTIVGNVYVTSEPDLAVSKIKDSGEAQWVKYHGISPSEGSSIIESNDGGLAAVGSTGSFGDGRNDIWLLKMDQHGDTLWTRTFGTLDDELGSCIRQTNDGGYIICGYTQINSSQPYQVSDAMLIKTNSTGELIWSRTYGDGLSTEFHSVVQTGDGDYISVGNTRVSGTSNTHIWILKTDQNGDSLWSRIIAEPNSAATCIIEVSDTSFAITGWKKGVDQNLYIWLSEIDTNGNTLFAQTYNIRGLGNSVCKSQDGGFVVSAMDNDKIIVIKTNDSGQIQWEKYFNVTSNHYLECNLNITTDGGYIIISNNNDDLYLIKIDDLGNTLLTGTYDGYKGYSIIQTSDNGYVVIGRNSKTPSQLSVIKFEPDSVLTSVRNKPVEIDKYKLYQNHPNPANPGTTISFDLPRKSRVSLKIFSTLGQEVATLVSDRLSAGSYEYNWDAGHLASGVYLYRLEAEGFVQTRKMILMK